MKARSGYNGLTQELAGTCSTLHFEFTLVPDLKHSIQ